MGAEQSRTICPSIHPTAIDTAAQCNAAVCCRWYCCNTTSTYPHRCRLGWSFAFVRLDGWQEMSISCWHSCSYWPPPLRSTSALTDWANEWLTSWTPPQAPPTERHSIPFTQFRNLYYCCVRSGGLSNKCDTKSQHIGRPARVKAQAELHNPLAQAIVSQSNVTESNKLFQIIIY